MNDTNATKRRRIPLQIAVAFTSIFFLTVVLSARADTYNFIFDKKNKKQGEQTEEAKPPQAQKEVSQPQPVPQTTQAMPQGQLPIIINNNVAVPSQQMTLPPVVKQPPPAPPAITSPPAAGHGEGPAQMKTVVSRPFDEKSRWKMALTGMIFFQDFEFANVVDGELNRYTRQKETYGGLLTLGYNFTESFAINVYGGARYAKPNDKRYYHVGMDFEIIPIRIPVTRNWELFELGFLLGASNALAAKDNWGTLHVGARVNINIMETFGLTVSTRANLGHVLLEGGLTARI